MTYRSVARWLHARAENVAVILLTAMFVGFILQIASRYVFNHPLGWTLEFNLTMWLWVVFWGAAFCLRDGDHVRFDLLYLMAGARSRRVMSLIAALAILVGFLVGLPGAIDYISFEKIKTSATMHIRLDHVFSVYGLFAVAIILRYAWRVWRLLRGLSADPTDDTA